jgi:type IV secretory pathway TraG/TraD family ATPase VirD4
LAESRKYGCCVVIGYQSYSEVESIYGKKGAEFNIIRVVAKVITKIVAKVSTKVVTIA